MLLLVLILVLIAFGLLVVALLTEFALWAWVSVAVSVVAGAVLVIDWTRRRRVGTRQADRPALRTPVPAQQHVPVDPATEYIPVVPDQVPGFDTGNTIVIPRGPSGSPAQPPAAPQPATQSGDQLSPSVAEDAPVAPSGTTASAGAEPVVDHASASDAPLAAAGSTETATSDTATGTSMSGTTPAGPAVSAPAVSGPESTPEPVDKPAPAASTGSDVSDVGAAEDRDQPAEAESTATESAGADEAERSEPAVSVPMAGPADQSGPAAQSGLDEPGPDEPGPDDSGAEPAESDAAASDAPVPAEAESIQPAAVGSTTGPDIAAEPAADHAPERSQSATAGAATEGAASSAASSAVAATSAAASRPAIDAEAAAAEQSGRGIFDNVDDQTMVMPAAQDAEPPEEPRDPSNAALVAELLDEVAVVDERPRYHLAACRFLPGMSLINLPVREAVELGFTPCGWCNPDRTLSNRHRATSSR